MQRLAEHAAVALQKLRAHIHYFYLRQRGVVHAVRKLYQRIPPAERPPERAYGRCCAAQHNSSPAQLSALLRHLCRAITRGMVAMVALLVFFIYYNQLYPFKRGKHGAARAYYNINHAKAYPAPFVIPFAIGQAAVQHGNALPKAAAEALHCLRRERYFRHKHYRLPAQ